jgi:translation initiation factor 4E
MYIPFASRVITPSTPSRLGSAASSPNLALSSSGSVPSHLSRTDLSANASPIVQLPPLNSRSSNLSINVHPSGPSPLSNNTRAENRPLSPAMITPTPSPRMGQSHGRSSDMLASKSPILVSNGGTNMRRLGSGQGTNAFAGPMAGGAKSPRASEARLGPLNAGHASGYAIDR